MVQIYYPVVGFLIGLILGSFANVCLTRRDTLQFWRQTRSFCDHCKRPLTWYENIPVISYLCLRGRSYCCNKKIKAWYPITELGFGILGVLLILKFNFLRAGSSGLPQLDSAELIRFIHAFILVLLIFVATVIDWREMVIPDPITIGLMVTSPLVAWLHPDLDIISSLLGLFIGFGSFYLLSWTYFLLRGQVGLGAGDVKYIGGLGGWLGVQSLMPIILVSSLTGSLFGIVILIMRRKDGLKTAFPFGPFLGLGALVFLFAGPWQEWVLSLRKIL